MKILTIGASPYLLVRNGKIHADIIQKLVNENFSVTSAVWHHDENYFMPNDEGVHNYEFENEKKCELHPFTPKTPAAAPFIYELLKKVQPNMVITVGDYDDTNFFYAIKCMYPNLFKWLAVYTVDTCGIHESHRDAFESVDAAIVTSMFGLNEISNISNFNGIYLPYGYDEKIYHNTDSSRSGVLKCARNSQASNLGAFIQANSVVDYKSHIHTNLYDPGDFDLQYLKNKYDARNLTYTQEYCSIQDGIDEQSMASQYNSFELIVDCSIKSATGLSLLEGMACGCVPIGISYGRVGEILQEMPEYCRFTVPHNSFIGQNSEEFAIINSEKLKELINKLLNDKSLLKKASAEAVATAKKYTRQNFIDGFFSIFARTMNLNFSMPLTTI